jgi:RHS repeat-associated protein
VGKGDSAVLVVTEYYCQYDYGARFYDPVIGRWSSVDPLAEKMLDVTAYNYGDNNPIKMTDQGGRFAVSVHYQITYRTLLSLGYSKKDADLMAHYSSTYADHPSSAVLRTDAILHNYNGPGPGGTYGYRDGINYSKTAKSQDEANSM